MLFVAHAYDAWLILVNETVIIIKAERADAVYCKCIKVGKGSNRTLAYACVELYA